MSAISPRPLSPTFLPSLNALLASLDLPFTLDNPTDLAPSLLLAILESLIDARLPIPQTVRVSRTREAKSRAMLVLLGVLDVDGWMDEIGLGDVDPERLADGGWEETIFVGELLCWLARRKGILPRLKRPYRSVSRTMRTRSLYSNPDFSTLSHITDVPRHPLVHSPEHSLSHSNSGTTGTDLSIRAHSVSSRTSLSGSHGDGYEEAGSEGTVHPYEDDHDAEEDEDHPPIFRPLCIHELEDPSYICALAGPSPSSFASSGSQDHAIDPSDAEGGPSDGEDSHYEDREDEQDTDDPYAPPTPTPRRVRLTGWIDEVDTATELSQFAASRTTTHVPSSSRAHAPIRTHITEPELNPDPRTSTTSSSSRKTHTSRSTFMTASLLTERARLLTELAAVKRARAASGSHEVGVGLLA
ncbi:hypothetical protein BS17DRAFT_755292 [Gyrodon lividus]|nr:hypothetical protein BS17DRAFT_755292 [Gyrodon lividus]